MGVLWHKIFYDLWRNRLRTLLVILSITVGVFAVGTTFGMVDQMLPVMDAAHRSTRPAHVTLSLDQPVSRDVIQALRRVPGVEDAEGSNTVEIRYKLQPGAPWRVGNILARDDYHTLKYDLLQLKAGEWPEERRLAIERMHAPFYGIDLGSTVWVEINGQEHPFEISGKIRHPFVPPPSMYDMAWFFGGPEVMEMFGIPPGRFTEIRLRARSYSAENARHVAGEVKQRLAQQGIGVRYSLYQDPEEHWGRAFIDGMSLVIQVLAVLSLLLSVILVLNTLTALITQQTNQIGILKAIGGSSFAIARMYLTGVFFYGLISLLVALPLGALASFSITKSFLALYNIDYDLFSISRRALGYQGLAALIAPLAAALFPVISGSVITVRQAIASYGIGGDFGSSRLDRAVEKIGRRFLASYDAIALANTFRRKTRLTLSQLVLVTAGTMFLMVMSLSTSITATVDAEFARRDHDLIFTFSRLQRVDRMTALAESISGVDHAGMWLILPATILQDDRRMLDAGMGSQLQGVPVEDPLYRPMIAEGRWLQPGDGRAIVLNQQTADDEGIRVGDRITLDLGSLGKDDWQVVGLYRVFLVFGGGFSVDAIYAPRQAVYEASKKDGRAATLLVRTFDHSPAGVNAVSKSLEDTLDQRHIEVRQIESMPQLRKTSDASFSIVIAMLLTLAAVVALVGGIGLMGSLWIGVIERTKEIGILRAIGATSGALARMFLLEGLIQGALSWLIAMPVSLLVSPLLANALGQVMFNGRLDYSYNITALWIWLGIVLTLSALASIIPARSASGINVRQSLSYE